MVEITKTQNSISIKGHANYAEHGKDIVCAAVSALTQTLTASIEELTDDEIKYNLSPGTVDINHKELSKQAQILISSFFIGIQMIADAYPEHVKLTER